jgi:hypothetical protein
VPREPKPARAADVVGDARARSAEPLVRAWWARVPRMLWAPREVLVSLRSTDEDDETARQEPILAVLLLAGITAVVLMGGTLIDDPSVDALVVAAVTFIAGAIYGAASYLVVGLGVLVGVRSASAESSFRQARHLVAFAAVPVAAAVVPVTLVVVLGYGLDWFRGSAPSSATTVVLAVGLPFVAWTAGLLVAGLRVTYRLAWVGVATAIALGAVFVAVVAALPVIL